MILYPITMSKKQPNISLQSFIGLDLINNITYQNVLITSRYQKKKKTFLIIKI